MDPKKALQYLSSLPDDLNDIKSSINTSKLDEIRRKTHMLIRQIFGEESEYLRDLNQISFINYFGEHDMETWVKGWNQLKNLLNVMMDELEIKISSQSDEQSNLIVQSHPLSNEVFIVHGHYDAMKEAVARTLGTLDLEPIILHEKPDKGRTIIEKFIEYSNVSFAVVLLSPDDFGYAKKDGSDSQKSRARQNVILELGFFIGRLGREHVVVLHAYEKNFEIPSDYHGVLFIPFDNDGIWKFKLVQELQACGFDVDANKLTKTT